VAVNSIYASIIPSYKYNLVLKSFSYGTQVMGHPYKFSVLIFTKMYKSILVHAEARVSEKKLLVNSFCRKKNQEPNLIRYVIRQLDST
jgi:hypothetical protein